MILLKKKCLSIFRTLCHNSWCTFQCHMLKQIKVTQREGQCMQFKLQNGYRIMIIYSSESFNKLIMILTWFKKLVGQNIYLPTQVQQQLLPSFTTGEQFNYVFDRCYRWHIFFQNKFQKLSKYIIQNWKSSQLSNAWFFLSRNSKNSMILFSFLFFLYLRTKILK